jgi:anion-transporting  ArsA/GET3 family ATPase
MASFDRFVDFMDGGDFDLIVFDTAPTGHTIRLLELPVDWSKHIEESAKGSGQTCLGPVAAIQESKAKYDRAIALLTNPGHTRFVFVLHPERTALYETERASTELARIGVKSQELIVNGLLPVEACESPFFRRRHDMQQEQLRETRARFALPIREMLLRDEEVKGIANLREVARGLDGGRQGATTRPAEGPAPAPSPAADRCSRPSRGSGARTARARPCSSPARAASARRPSRAWRRCTWPTRAGAYCCSPPTPPPTSDRYSTCR